ncbi:unnamed protein product (macronuclear) [Paramecium tetraurelia]|uniref:Uncharacterized protein n=1 Tax=Paramecium tetraurelia TaxID=5888 RepID=A0BUM2_PARTE|nr:uncharacterized protein GSPATT00005485001 [Paramecium tetraurelia]CAK62239.1 unnamed protein product [Paramecium tetraurelia]|eukprot:XP_001429637.1 hypothetical protein (macronuclear) [Paramecium tetraurelia strain d4-2]
MGICNTKKQCQNTMNTNPTSQYSTNPSILEKITNPKKKKQKPNMNIVVSSEPQQYDPLNPHRQFNVIINGVRFEIINSIENCIISNEELEE